MGREKPPNDRLFGLLFWALLIAIGGLAAWAVRALPYFSFADLY